MTEADPFIFILFSMYLPFLIAQKHRISKHEKTGRTFDPNLSHTNLLMFYFS